MAHIKVILAMPDNTSEKEAVETADVKHPLLF